MSQLVPTVMSEATLKSQESKTGICARIGSPISIILGKNSMDYRAVNFLELSIKAEQMTRTSHEPNK